MASTLVTNMNDDIEQIWVLLKANGKKIAIGCIYNPPASPKRSFLNELHHTLDNMQGMSDEIFCVGDGNIDFLDIENTYTRGFNEILEELSLRQLISSPTRTNDKTSTAIDFIITNENSMVVSSGSEQAHFSDHDLIYCEIPYINRNPRPTVVTYRTMRYTNHLLLELDLHSLPLNYIFRINDINEKVLFFNQQIAGLLDTHAPMRVSSFSKPFAPWLTDSVKEMMKLRDRALSRFKQTKRQEHWSYYKTLRNMTTAAIRKERKVYLRTVVAENNIGKMWKTLRLMNVTRDSRPAIKDDLKDVNLINEFFNNFERIPPDNNLYEHFMRNKWSPSDDEFKFAYVDTSVILNIIINIKSTAAGVDEFNINFLKLCCPYIVQYITHIINCCFEQSLFPDEWKIALITPLPKVNEPNTINDLRPISVLPLIAKIMEKCMEIQLKKFVNDNNILPAIQSGFRSGHSCSTALLKVSDDILTARDKGMGTILVLLDYSKAFDRVNHQLLLAILKYLGLNKSAVQLLRSFLDGRRQIVKLDNIFSKEIVIKSGVPQGSVLSALLFTLYTSQIPSKLRYSKIHMYADDIQIYAHFNAENITDVCAKLNTDLQTIYAYSRSLCLTLNPSKSKVVVCGAYNPDDICISLNNEILEIELEAKNLGVIFDGKLRFGNHVTACIKKAYTGLRSLYPHRHSLEVNVKKKLCDALILSLFTHADTVYGPCLLQRDVYRIQRVQNSCLRFIYGIRKFDRISHALVQANWLNMKNRRKLHLLCLSHKIVTEKAPPYLYNKISFRTDVHNINIRHRHVITIPIHKTALFRRSFSYSLASGYNECPNEVKNLNLQSFKRSVRKMLYGLQNSQSVH